MTVDLHAEFPTPLNPRGTDSQPVTIGALKELLTGLQQTIQADVTSLCVDITGMVSRLSTLESSSDSQTRRIAALENLVKGLQQQQALTKQRFASLDDQRRCKNHKVWGIPEEIPAAELPIW
ncbi:Hypothetical predicted protein [Pelobates cultripes]|uniref:Uncharacterized protein n=1 Tax=Pelobates cultripes TaxID=61616 RepID=A0AAD1SHB7_PELCU|nr:Hypothetical predicted protein [Pelobates cultripes]